MTSSLLYFSFLSFRKVLLIYLLLFFLYSSILLSSVSSEDLQTKRHFLGTRRSLLETQQQKQEGDKQLLQKPKKKSTPTTTTTTSKSALATKNQTKLFKPSQLSTKNQTKLIKTSLPSKNQTKLIKTSLSSKNQTNKLLKPTNSTKSNLSNLSKSELKKLNSTSNKPLKATNSTKVKSSDLKLISSKNKTTTKNTSTKLTQTLLDIKEAAKPKPKQEKTQKQKQQQKQPSWIDQENDDDLVLEFRNLPVKFQQTLLPDLEKISTTSKAYLNKYNKEITNGFKPIVGHKYASTIASAISFAFILLPLVLVSLIFNRIKAYFSLQKILIFIQVYLSIYFSILCVSSLVTGLEPLKFFYATSQSTYVGLQVLQTLGYVFYLLLLLMYLILVFSTDCGLGSRILGLAQMFVGYAVGLHYYVAVFHRVVLHQPPKTNWKIHGIYATCFLVICVIANAERRKKAYLEEGGEEGKKN